MRIVTLVKGGMLCVLVSVLCLPGAGCAQSQPERAQPIGNKQHATGSPRAQTDTSTPTATNQQQTEGQFLVGNRVVFGTVEAVAGNQVKVNVGEMQPRFLPLEQAKEKGIASIKPGDRLVIVLSSQNLVVDYHLADDPRSHHRIVQGQIAQNLSIGHDHAVIRLGGGEETLEIRPLARSKMASIPVGVDALFLIDEGNKIADAAFANAGAVDQAKQVPELKSPLKGAHQQVEATVIGPFDSDRIMVRTQEGKEQALEVRSPAKEKVARLERGETVTFLVDTDHKVIDVASPNMKPSQTLTR
ncbi:MAG: hypothetical protein ACT4OO_09165 [Nitrospiraceae bacterium]